MDVATRISASFSRVKETEDRIFSSRRSILATRDQIHETAARIESSLELLRHTSEAEGGAATAPLPHDTAR